MDSIFSSTRCSVVVAVEVAIAVVALAVDLWPNLERSLFCLFTGRAMPAWEVMVLSYATRDLRPANPSITIS
jgi:hypothetical protein